VYIKQLNIDHPYFSLFERRLCSVSKENFNSSILKKKSYNINSFKISITDWCYQLVNWSGAHIHTKKKDEPPISADKEVSGCKPAKWSETTSSIGAH